MSTTTTTAPDFTGARLTDAETNALRTFAGKELERTYEVTLVHPDANGERLDYEPTTVRLRYLPGEAPDASGLAAQAEAFRRAKRLVVKEYPGDAGVDFDCGPVRLVRDRLVDTHDRNGNRIRKGSARRVR